MKKMKNYLKSTVGLLIIPLLLTNCTTQEEVDTLTETDSFVVTSLTSQVYQISDFYIETSWLTGEDSKTTNSFDSSSTDNEDWYDKNSSGNYVMTCLATDGNRTEWKEIGNSEMTEDKSIYYQAQVSNIPENGVTIAQIHNRATTKIQRPYLRVYIDDDSKIKIKTTDNNPTSDSGSYTTYPGSTYTEGSTFNLSITYNGSSATIDVTDSSGSTIINETVTPSSSWDDYSSGYFFKAGVYTEGDDTQPKITFNYFYFND